MACFTLIITSEVKQKMRESLIFLIGLSGISFLTYGLLCLLTSHMSREFERYGLAQFRKLVGALETLGAIGLFAGLLWKPVLLMSAIGLCALMLLGLIVRLRCRDPFVQIIPALVLLIVNALIVYLAW
jgi:hypothetical protein